MSTPNSTNPYTDTPDESVELSELVHEKLIDAQAPGFQAQFEADEAELAGAFFEDALTEDDALESAVDVPASLTFSIRKAAQ
jgi:hypothetical protein